MLKKADTSQLLCLAEIALNILRSKFKLTSRQKKRLLPHAEFVRRLGRLRTEGGAKKLLVQKGGAAHIGLLSALLTPIILEIGKSLLHSSAAKEEKAEEEQQKDGE